MSRSSPFTICLSEPDRVVLVVEPERAYTESFASVVLAKIVLLVAEGVTNVMIAARFDVDVVSKWRKRFFKEGVED